MHTLLRLALVVTMAVVAGCSEPKATVKGAILEDGQPKSFKSNQAAVQLTLVNADGQLDNSKSFTAVVNEDGRFEVIASGGEIPVGKYQVAIQFTGGNKKYQKWAAPESTVRRDIKSGANELTLDLSAP